MDAIAAQTKNVDSQVCLSRDAQESSLFRACKIGELKTVEKLINAQVDVNFQTGRRGKSPLYIASHKGHHQVVDSLIRAQADVNLLTKNLMSPLFAALRNGHRQVVDSLIKAQADVNLQNSNCESPLYIASQDGNHQAVDSLIKALADVNLQDMDGFSPIYIASQNGHCQVVDSLIKAQADVNMQENDGCTPLYIASQQGHHQIVDSLIRAPADVNIQENDGASPIYIAAQQGHCKVVDSLINAQANFNLQSSSGSTPLYIASQNGHHQVVASLIKAGADVNLRKSTGTSPLFIAAQAGHCQIIDSLIKAGADVNHRKKTGESPLYVASQNGHRHVVVSLINALADVNLQRNTGSTPLYIASQHGHHQIVDSLIGAQADVNLQFNTGESPLYIASKIGHHQVVESLIRAQADATISTSTGDLPLSAAAESGHHRVVGLFVKSLTAEDKSKVDGLSQYLRMMISDKSTFHSANEVEMISALSDAELGHQLHVSLNESGFVDSRAAMQSAVADVLQTIQRGRCSNRSIFVVGSFSEGWGNSLVTLDGRTDIESDIDVMKLMQGRLYHINNLCQCAGVTDQLEYSNGHILCPGFASNPASPSRESALRPAVDQVDACRLCCYPPIAPLLPDRVSKSNIPQSVLQSLSHQLTTSPCHVVHAASPGQAGKQLRVSTTFLEKRLLRSLSTLQGQLFVTLKYLVKKVICHKDGFNVQGVKAYHVKTITFRMLEETPAEQWQPKNLVSLTRRSLQMLLDSVESSCSSDNADGRIMDHFFLCDAALYLKGADRNSALEITRVLRDVSDQLPQLLKKFNDRLRPVSDSGRFYFHPFQIIPFLEPEPLSMSISLEYHEIYDVVRESLLHLFQGDLIYESFKYLIEMIGRLPDCARSAREALRAMTCLKFGNRDAAVKVLMDCRGHEVSRGIAWSAERSATEATADFVWQHLRTCDSAWKFCFKFDESPTFEWLPRLMRECFPIEMRNYGNYYYMNFDALLHSLHLEFSVDDGCAEDWVEGVAERGNVDADVQELMVSAAYCDDSRLLVQLFGHINPILCSVPCSLDMEFRSMLQTRLAALRSRLSGLAAGPDSLLN